MNVKKVLRGALAVSLSFLLATQALAAVVEHDISMSDLIITQEDVNPDGYRVTGSTDEYSVTVEDGVTTEIELDNVTIGTYERSAIDIQGEADVTLNLTGENHLTSENAAVIHVTGGDLTVTSESGGKLIADADIGEEEWEHAAIGSNEGEDFSGSITIGGNANVEADSDNDGAGIGTGQGVWYSEYDEELDIWVSDCEGGEMSGTITVQDDAVVDAYSDDDGAGIGAGMYGEMSGTILIKDNAQVKALSEEDGAGIGSGDSSNVSGTILIEGNAQVDAEADETGAGIGSGEGGEMGGTITIRGNANVKAKSGKNGAGIGSGAAEEYGYYDEYDNWIVNGYEGGEMSGTIIIGNNASVTAVSDEGGDAIGAGGNGTLTGTVLVDQGEFVPTYTLSNGARDIRAVVRGEDAPGRLLESEISGEALAALTEGVEEAAVLRACHLEFDGEYEGAVLLTFFLNGEELGKRVEIRWLEDGEVVRRTVPVSEEGTARVTLRQVGDFVVVMK